MILNRQRRVKLSISKLEKFLVRARKELCLPANSFAVCLVTEKEIAKWNGAYRGKARPTDVLSFPAADLRPSNASRAGGKGKKARRKIAPSLSNEFFVPTAENSASADYLGDVAIAPAVARRNAKRFERTLEEEMRILILHGMLHLMGYDHETDSGQMERREWRLRRSLGLA